MKKEIGDTLRKCRLEANLTVKEISDLLISKGFKASEKTIYSWENGNSQPSPDALLLMCKAYDVRDVLATFGYSEPEPPKPTTLAAHFDGEEYTQEELDKIKEFAAFVRATKES